MPQVCSVCRHERRAEIDEALLKAVPLRNIAGQYHVSKSALMRHKERDMPVSLAHAAEAREAASGENLWEQARHLHARALKILDQAEAAGQLETALRAIREARGVVELLAKLDGQIQDRERAGGAHLQVSIAILDQIIERGSARKTVEISAAPVATSSECMVDCKETEMQVLENKE